MNDRSRTVSKLQFFLSLVFLLFGVLSLVSLLSRNRSQNNYLAENLVITIAILLTVTFALGWLFGIFIEHAFLSRGRSIATLVFLGAFVVFLSLWVGSSLLTRDSFVQETMKAVAYIYASGFCLRYARAQQKIFSKLRGRY
jgi:hypothetical protein